MVGSSNGDTQPSSLGFAASSRVLGDLSSFVPAPRILDGTQDWGTTSKILLANSRKQYDLLRTLPSPISTLCFPSGNVDVGNNHQDKCWLHIRAAGLQTLLETKTAFSLKSREMSVPRPWPLSPKPTCLDGSRVVDLRLRGEYSLRDLISCSDSPISLAETPETLLMAQNWTILWHHRPLLCLSPTPIAKGFFFSSH